MDAQVTADSSARAELYEKMALLLAAHDIDEIGAEILTEDATAEEVILCIEGGSDYWYNDIEELFGEAVLSEYGGLGEDAWILIRAGLAACVEIASTVGNPMLDARLRTSPEHSLVRVLMLFDSGEVATDDVLVKSRLN